MNDTMPVDFYTNMPLWMLQVLADLGDKRAMEVLILRRFFK